MNLSRFLDAQEKDYQRAMAEIKSGKKRSHWMWYIFPQLAGLGLSAMSQQYAIRDLNEADQYLKHPVLGSRLVEICEALLQLPGNNANTIFGSPDDVKLRSCMTLFAQVPHAPDVFRKVLAKFFNNQPDAVTLRLIQLLIVNCFIVKLFIVTCSL